MSFERRKPNELPADPEITDDLVSADEKARREFAERGHELLDRLRNL